MVHALSGVLWIPLKPVKIRISRFYSLPYKAIIATEKAFNLIMQKDKNEEGAPVEAGGMAQVVERNIKALLHRRHTENQQRSWQDQLADAITKFAGSMPFVLIHLILFGGWILWNSNIFGLKPFDPSFVVLAMFASVEAIFLSTFVLISQNRSAALADKRADLDLQVSLLAEHEITHLIKMVTAIAKKLDVPVTDDPEIQELTQNVHPEKVLDTIENNEKEAVVHS